MGFECGIKFKDINKDLYYFGHLSSKLDQMIIGKGILNGLTIRFDSDEEDAKNEGYEYILSHDTIVALYNRFYSLGETLLQCSDWELSQIQQSIDQDDSSYLNYISKDLIINIQKNLFNCNLETTDAELYEIYHLYLFLKFIMESEITEDLVYWRSW